MKPQSRTDALLSSLRTLAGLPAADRKDVLRHLPAPARRRVKAHLKRLDQQRGDTGGETFSLSVRLHEAGLSAAFARHIERRLAPAEGRLQPLAPSVVAFLRGWPGDLAIKETGAAPVDRPLAARMPEAPNMTPVSPKVRDGRPFADAFRTEGRPI